MLNYMPRLCINRPFMHRKISKSSFFASSSYQPFADNDGVFLSSIRLVVLKLYDAKRDTVENVHDTVENVYG